MARKSSQAPDEFEQAAAAARADREADQLIADMIDGTNNEIASAAWGDEPAVHDDTGDQTIEAMGEGLEGQHEADEGEEDDSESETEEDAGEEDTGEEGEGEDAQPSEPKPAEPEKPEGRVPPGRLREATERARAAEAERDALKGQFTELQGQSKAQIDALNARLDRLMTALQPGQKPEPKPEPAKRPDVFEDPNAFADHLTREARAPVDEVRQELANIRVQMSLQIAEGRHGDTFREAVGEIAKLDQSNPNNQRLVADLYNAANPGEALVTWHKRNVALREVGDDPAKYRERIANETRDALMKDPEFRKQLLEGLRAEATTGANGKPNTTVRIPPSLNGARGGRETVDTSFLSAGDQQSIADSAWDDR